MTGPRATDDPGGDVDAVLARWRPGDPVPEGITRAERRRLERDVIEDGAPREGVDIIRPVERAVIVGLHLPGDTTADMEASLDELELLLDTAGAEVVERVVQRRDSPEPATFIGRGKASELAQLVKQVGADAVVFDDNLAPAQQRNLEEAIRQKVLDRTIVILDIFAQHASSLEGKAQVELAQLTYLLPRLRGWGDARSRQAGGRTAGGAGIGGRGPGETQLEVDRRRIHRRMTKLRKDLTQFARVRRTKAQRRERNQVPVASLVGYTNAGKSSLLNRLTGASVLVEDQLFATLDPTARQLELPDGRQIVCTDTVGFVRKLPHGLVEAFKATLEQTMGADLLVHVVDASHPEAESHVLAVHEVLAEIDADEVDELIVLNKADVAEPSVVRGLARRLQQVSGHEPMVVSAHTGEGIDELVDRLAVLLPGRRVRVVAEVPYARQELVAMAHEYGEVHDERYDERGTTLDASVDPEVVDAMRPYLVVDPDAREPEPWEARALSG